MQFLRRIEVLAPLSFLVIALLWALFSDRFFSAIPLINSFFPADQMPNIEAVVFICSAAVLMFLMIKYSKKQLVQSQDEFKDLFYNTPNPMFIVDLKTKRFCSVNEAALKLYGYSAEEFSKLTLSDVRSPVQQRDEQSCEDKKGRIFKYKKKNEQIIYCCESSNEISFKNEQVCLLSAHDITELEKAKADLIRRENQLKQILNSITDGFFILSPDLTIVKANALFKKISEVQSAEVEGKKLSDLFPSLAGGSSFMQYEKAIETHTSVYFETFNNKSSTWFRISGYPYEGGLSVFFRDITKEKENEFYIYQNEQNLVALINNTEDPIWSLDVNFKYFTFNRAYEQWYYRFYNDEIWIGKTVLDKSTKEENIQKWKGLYERAFNGEKFSIDMNFVIDTECLYATVSFNPIFSAERKVTGAGCFLQNITERKLHERKIVEHNQKLRDIASITSHKIRVPLTNILGLAEILDREDPLSESNRTIIEHIKTSSLELDKTITNMVQQTLQVHD